MPVFERETLQLIKYKTKKMNTPESKERKFEKKSKRNRMNCFNIYIVVFAFLSSTVEEDRW